MPEYHQAYLIAYEQTKNHVENERDVEMAKAMTPKMTGGGRSKGRKK